MLFLSKFDDFMNSLFKDANGNFDLKIFFALLIGIIMLVLGIKFVYDARPIVKKYFKRNILSTY